MKKIITLILFVSLSFCSFSNQINKDSLCYQYNDDINYLKIECMETDEFNTIFFENIKIFSGTLIYNFNYKNSTEIFCYLGICRYISDTNLYATKIYYFNPDCSIKKTVINDMIKISEKTYTVVERRVIEGKQNDGCY